MGGVALPALIQRLTPATGSEAASEATIKHLRASSDAPASKRFGWGQGWEQEHLVKFVEAATGAQPSDGPSVVAAVARSRYQSSAGAGEDQRPRLGDGTLHEVLVRLMAGFVRTLTERVVAKGLALWSAEADLALWPVEYDPERSAPDHLTFHFSPFKVEVVWLGRGGHDERVDVYAPSLDDQQAMSTLGLRWQRSVISRTAKVPISLLLMAAKAWLETSPRRGGDPARTLPSTEGDTHHGAPEIDER
jgi:hypothetical protein